MARAATLKSKDTSPNLRRLLPQVQRSPTAVCRLPERRGTSPAVLSKFDTRLTLRPGAWLSSFTRVAACPPDSPVIGGRRRIPIEAYPVDFMTALPANFQLERRFPPCSGSFEKQKSRVKRGFATGLEVDNPLVLAA
jgi:hypothetical protein